MTEETHNPSPAPEMSPPTLPSETVSMPKIHIFRRMSELWRKLDKFWLTGLLGLVCNFVGGILLLWYSSSVITFNPNSFQIEVGYIPEHYWKFNWGISLLLGGFLLQIIAHFRHSSRIMEEPMAEDIHDSSPTPESLPPTPPPVGASQPNQAPPSIDHYQSIVDRAHKEVEWVRNTYKWMAGFITAIGILDVCFISSLPVMRQLACKV